MTALAAPMTPAATTARRARRVHVLRGGLMLAFGVAEAALVLLAFRLPHVTVVTLVLALNAFLVLDAIAVALPAIQAREPWRGWAPQALVSLVAGVLLLFVPYGRWLVIFGVWAIFSGVLDGAHVIASGSGRVVLSVLSLALGILLLAGPLRDHALLLLVVSAYGIVTGILRLLMARTAPGARAIA